MHAGTVLRDKYQLVASIGRGGMGEVFHAVHVPSGTDVAIKVVNREILDDMMMARLEREAAAAARIQSPYVPRVLDVDRLGSGEVFLVMELLHGESFSERLKNGAVLSWDEVFNIGDNILRALIDAHEAGVVHRDLKPGNVFIEHLSGGLARARILDFGVCKLDEQDTKKLTITGESVGTIAYMAPEQIRGASKVDERADLYSFAMIVYEALCGHIPYESQGQMALLATKLEKAAYPLKGRNRVPVPAGLDALLSKSLSRKPGDRPANAREMLRAWQNLGPPTSQPNLQIQPSIPGLSASSPPTQLAVTAAVRSGRSIKSQRSLVALSFGVLALTAAIAFALFVRRTPAGGSFGASSVAPVRADVPSRVDGVGVAPESTATVSLSSSSLDASVAIVPVPVLELDDGSGAQSQSPTKRSSLPPPAPVLTSPARSPAKTPAPRAPNVAAAPTPAPIATPTATPSHKSATPLVEQPRY